jgi:hypothetical protein
MAWPRTLPSYDPNPPRPPGEIPQLEVPGLKIVQAYQPGQTFGRSATANAQPFSAIVSHYTGGENLQSALSTAKGDPGRGGVPYGYHFVIDKDGTVYQTAPLDARTNHVMPPGSQYRSDRPDISNNNAMGISFVGGGENPTPAALEAARKLYPAVQQRFNIPSQNIVGHGEIQAKGKDSRAADEGMTIVKELRGQPPTQTAQAAPKAAPGKPLGDTMTGGPTVTPTQAFSPTPTSAVAGSPAQQAITGAINPQPSFPTGNVGPQATGANPAMYLPGNRNMNTGQGGAPFYQVPAPPFQPAQAPQAAPQAPPTKAAPAPAQAAPQPEIPTRVYPGQQSTNYPDQRLPPSVGTGTGTVPLPYQRPAGAGPAVPADQKPASARAPAAAPQSAAQAASAPPSSGLGNQMPVAGGYVDPNTGRQIVNPSGSGEQAMGLTRDIGPAVPARPAPAQTGAGNRNTPSGKPVRPPPTGPVPPAPDAAGRLAKPENMPAPEQTLKTLDASRQKPNTLTGLYGSQTPPTNPPQGATFRDIANAPPAFGGPKGSTLTDLPLPPYNVGGPGGTPLPPPRPNFGPDSGAPVARNYLRPGPAATPQEQAQQDAARATEQRYAAAQGPGPATAGPPPAPQPRDHRALVTGWALRLANSAPRPTAPAFSGRPGRQQRQPNRPPATSRVPPNWRAVRVRRAAVRLLLCRKDRRLGRHATPTSLVDRARRRAWPRR